MLRNMTGKGQARKAFEIAGKGEHFLWEVFVVGENLYNSIEWYRPHPVVITICLSLLTRVEA